MYFIKLQEENKCFLFDTYLRILIGNVFNCLSRTCTYIIVVDFLNNKTFINLIFIHMGTYKGTNSYTIQKKQLLLNEAYVSM